MNHRPPCTRRGIAHLGLVGVTGLWAIGLGSLGACGASLLPKPPAMPTLYALDLDEPDASSQRAVPVAGARVLAVLAPRSAAGFDGMQMVYLRRAHQMEAYAHNAWVDTPARMLAPMLVRALQRSSAFQAVLGAPGIASADLVLDTEIIRLQQDFGSVPSHVRFTLRAMLIDTATRRVLAWREFDRRVAAPTEDPRGGVDAANQAARQVLGDVVAFCDASVAR